MIITNRTRIAVSCLADLVGRADPMTLHDLIVRHRVSKSYLEQMFSRLATGGLVVGKRGTGGGYRLGRQPHAITVGAVRACVEVQTEDPGTSTPWLRASNRVHRLLDALTLDAIAERPELRIVA